VLRGGWQVVTGLSVRYEAASWLAKPPMFGFGIELIAGGHWQTTIRPVPEVNT
jgi:hypothetical protein